MFILDHYIDNKLRVDKNSDLYYALVNRLPMLIKQHLNRDDLLIQGSMGKGNKTLFPWISILNKNITTSTQEGLYIVYLFRSDMKGFYLSLSQGITNFERKFGNKKYKYLEKVSNYFQNELREDSDFSFDQIDLLAKRNSRGFGYEKSTILSRFYKYNTFKSDQLVDDLLKMVEIYDSVYNHMRTTSYNQVIESIVSDDELYIPSDKAVIQIEHILQEESSYPRYEGKKLILVNALSEKSTKFKRIVEGSSSKIDHLKKAAQDAFTGLEGEKLVMDHEMERLRNIGLSDFSHKVEWISLQNDVKGYDIRSFDVDGNGKVHDLFIEVKTSISKVDTDFYVSKNEVETSKKLKDKYAVFRIYNVLSNQPKYYLAKGAIEDNFILEPSTFKASYKWRVE
jgi:hypothetical protein